MTRCAALFVAAVALTVVFALLTHCAAGLATSLSPAYAVLLILLVGAMHLAGKAPR